MVLPAGEGPKNTPPPRSTSATPGYTSAPPASNTPPSTYSGGYPDTAPSDYTAPLDPATSVPTVERSWLQSLVDRVKQQQTYDTAPANPFIPPEAERTPDRLADELGMSTGALEPGVERLLTGKRPARKGPRQVAPPLDRPDAGVMPDIRSLRPSRPPLRERLRERFEEKLLPEVTNQLVSGPGGTFTSVPMADQTAISANDAFIDSLVRNRQLAQSQPRDRDKTRETGDVRRKKHGEVDAMTWEEYNALTPDQRAAVDFNTMLVEAVRNDRISRKSGEFKDVTPFQRSTYDETVDKIFGSDGGSKRYAPATVAVLNEIDFTDEQADLDQFLNLRAAITESDLKNFMPPSSEISGAGEAEILADAREDLPEWQETKVNLSEHLADSTADMQASLERGVKLMRQYDVAAVSLALSDNITAMGGTPWAVDNIKGFGPQQWDPTNGGPADANTFFQLGFNDLANVNDPRSTEEIINTIRATLDQTGEWDEFVDYATVRARSPEAYNALVIDGVQYRSPKEFRALLRQSLKGERAENKEERRG